LDDDYESVRPRFGCGSAAVRLRFLAQGQPALDAVVSLINSSPKHVMDVDLFI